MRRPSPVYIARLVGTIALAIWGAACASSGAVPRPQPFPTPGGHAPATATGGLSVGGDALVASALALRGTPYRNGGTDPHGFDCSGFTQYVFAEHGVELPREVRDQYDVGRKIRLRSLEPGDLLFFTTTGPGPTHVGIAIGGDQFVHAPSSNGVVRVEHLNARYWKKRFLGARRIR